MASRSISVPSVVINNVAINIVPNSLKYKEGTGEQTVKTQSAGGGVVDVVYSDNAESKMSSVSFEMINTGANIESLLTWKNNANANAITLTDTATGFTRNFSNMALTTDYEVNLGSDTTISVDFMGDPAV